ncbi:MAG: Outer membrane protein assembly factor BamE [Sodalis sp.]|uniref:outer membrane protein assembly factor BamE n=1 Tax=Sodalis sp. (in: enterobacteria) TaxID=1898979 RepID=UPI003872F00A|nr:MAG: Outer membrane protein assembly factor BamE [Sodalis sp.]
MRCKTLTAAAVVMLMFTTGCSVFERVVYRPDINQGNYLTATDVAKIHAGMTKQQVAYTLGTSMIKDPFGSNIWYYIFRREPSHESVTQQTLTLTFNSSDILTHIDNKPMLESSSAHQ